MPADDPKPHADDQTLTDTAHISFAQRQLKIFPSVSSRPGANIACSWLQVHVLHHTTPVLAPCTILIAQSGSLACLPHGWQLETARNTQDITTIVRFILWGRELDPKLTIGHCDLTRFIKSRRKLRLIAYNRHQIRHEGSPRKKESCQQAAMARTRPALSQTAQQQPVSHLACPLQWAPVSSSTPSENPLHLSGWVLWQHTLVLQTYWLSAAVTQAGTSLR